ncbi:hypothetical protein KP509_02G010400 [Ceratopteris richardii]|uniref:RING-type domain-containing protein n=1 Tax=Ceratopteris richardii TaxID=49495 RepID=A0A8T2VBF3_CERRI|nr:hypothetical protein KP509_02G010400 [Ceratopteris richardii]
MENSGNRGEENREPNRENLQPTPSGAAPHVHQHSEAISPPQPSLGPRTIDEEVIDNGEEDERQESEEEFTQDIVDIIELANLIVPHEAEELDTSPTFPRSRPSFPRDSQEQWEPLVRAYISGRSGSITPPLSYSMRGGVPTHLSDFSRIRNQEAEPRRLQEADLADLPSVEVAENNEGGECPTCAICHDKLAVNPPAKRLPCNHIFHGSCIVTWLIRSNSCPICRSQVP